MSQVKCFNFNKLGHLSRNWRAPRIECKGEQPANLAKVDEEEPALLLAQAGTINNDESPTPLMATIMPTAVDVSDLTKREVTPTTLMTGITKRMSPVLRHRH